MKQLLDLLRISMMMLLTELNREAKGALDNLMAHKVKPEILIESAIHAEYMKMEDILTSLLTKIFKNLRKCSQSPDFSMLSCNSIEILFNLKLKKKRTSYVRFQEVLNEMSVSNICLKTPVSFLYTRIFLLPMQVKRMVSIIKPQSIRI